jgi:hypothetical protein
MVKNTGRHYKKHILTVFSLGDRLLLWDTITFLYVLLTVHLDICV